MNPTWQSGNEPQPAPIGPAGWLRVLARGLPLGIVVFGCLALLLLVRLAERPLFGPRRPVTPFITQFVCRAAFRILGIRRRVTGQPMQTGGALVSNHVSWLDIFALNACDRFYFVSKAEVRDWPGIGWLARATGTVFIERDRRRAREHRATFVQRLGQGHRLLFFPEGTSSDGLRILPFKSTLFSAFFGADVPAGLMVQPVTLVYRAPRGQEPRFYGWWGDMEFAPHLLQTLAARRQGAVEVIFHPPLPLTAATDRKTLAAGTERTILAALEARLEARAGPDTREGGAAG